MHAPGSTNCPVTCGEAKMFMLQIAKIRRPPAYGGKICQVAEGHMKAGMEPCQIPKCFPFAGKLS